MQVKPEVVIFDLFGTLVQYGVQLHPYRQLLKWAREHGRQPQSDDARTIMTFDADIEQLADHMGIATPAVLLRKLIDDIETELQSLTLFADVVQTLDALQESKIRLAICSNLAKPYGAVIPRLLSKYSLTNFLSYECGFIKPEPGIYRLIAAQMKVDTHQCLFIGDTYIADYQGPCKTGMRGLHLVRDGASSNVAVTKIAELSECFRYLSK